MKAAVIKSPYEVEIVEKGLPEIKEGEALISVKMCGICGSDLHVYRGKHPFVKEPRVPGHEFSGVVAEGDIYSRGEAVTVEPLIPCDKCDLCIRGEYNVCRNLKVIGIHVDGAMAEYVKVPEDRIYRLPKGVSFKEGALIEPLAVAVHIVRRAKVSLNDDVLILGAGPIGLLVLQVAKLLGVKRIFITDVVDYRLDLAEKLGADYTINASVDNVEEVVYKATNGLGVDIAIEAAGAPNTPLQAVKLTKPHGRVVIVGFFEEPRVPMDMTEIVAKELEIVGSRVYWHDFKTAIDLVTRRVINVKRIVTHSFPLEDVAKAFEVADKKLYNAVKVLVLIS
ncbi:MAG TPA: hypothetical protein ENK81_02105 [Euryarchaeota archaeon]|nr:hypothetical protein [Euryarchaeota archaeon]